jgi:hypothetical protein
MKQLAQLLFLLTISSIAACEPPTATSIVDRDRAHARCVTFMVRMVKDDPAAVQVYCDCRTDGIIGLMNENAALLARPDSEEKGRAIEDIKRQTRSIESACENSAGISTAKQESGV